MNASLNADARAACFLANYSSLVIEVDASSMEVREVLGKNMQRLWEVSWTVDVGSSQGETFCEGQN